MRPFIAITDCTICDETGGCGRLAGRFFRGVCPISNRAKQIPRAGWAAGRVRSVELQGLPMPVRRCLYPGIWSPTIFRFFLQRVRNTRRGCTIRRRPPTQILRRRFSVAVKEKIRIRIKGYDHQLVDQSAEKIVETARHTGARGFRLGICQSISR